MRIVEDINKTNNYTIASAISVLVSNDIHYMHFLSKGEDFDKCHNLAQEYYDKVNDETDYLMELALENDSTIVNYSNALSVIDNYNVESLDSYDYPTIITHLIEKLSIYVNALTELRNSVNAFDIQSKLDDMIRYWNKEINYKLNRRK